MRVVQRHSFSSLPSPLSSLLRPRTDPPLGCSDVAPILYSVATALPVLSAQLLFYLWLTCCSISGSPAVLSLAHLLFYLWLTCCSISGSPAVLSLAHLLFYLWLTCCSISGSPAVLSLAHLLFYLWLTCCSISGSPAVLSLAHLLFSKQSAQ